MQNNDALKTLHTALIDARTGYEKAVEKASDAQQLDIFQAMRALHESSRARVQATLTKRGEKPDQNGSFMSTVNKAVVSVRSAITGLDEHSLKAFASGEENVIDRYDAAIEENAGDRSLVGALQQDRDELVAMVARMKAAAA